MVAFKKEQDWPIIKIILQAHKGTLLRRIGDATKLIAMYLATGGSKVSIEMINLLIQIAKNV